MSNGSNTQLTDIGHNVIAGAHSTISLGNINIAAGLKSNDLVECAKQFLLAITQRKRNSTHHLAAGVRTVGSTETIAEILKLTTEIFRILTS